jgi:hypothetical protein
MLSPLSAGTGLGRLLFTTWLRSITTLSVNGLG